MKKQSEEEKNRLFFYASYGFDFRHGKSPTLARYKNIKIFFRFHEERKIQGPKGTHVNKAKNQTYQRKTGVHV